MSATRVAEGVWEIGLRQVNAFFLDAADGGVLMDTGLAGQEGWILGALKGDRRSMSTARCWWVPR